MKIMKNNINLLIPLIFFMIISLISVFEASILLNEKSLFYKQIIWYSLSLITMFFIMSLKIEKIIKNSFYFYLLGVISLILLLIFAKPINGSKCWFNIKGIGTIQPSEFMKIFLIIFLSKYMSNYKDFYVKNEFVFILKVGIISIFPCILTFLQPDTGIVIIYIFITLSMLFTSGLKKQWFILLFGFIFIILGIILLIYYTNSDLFLKMFGTDFFLRIDRILDWSNQSGFQLENSLISIGSAGIVGYGLFNTPLYLPEAQTDFIFAVYSSNFGFLGSLLLILVIVYFDFSLLKIASKAKSSLNKYLVVGFTSMLIYQQIQNISMTLGILPITGITLPFISYGGSSLISYFIGLGIILNKKSLKDF